MYSNSVKCKNKQRKNRITKQKRKSKLAFVCLNFYFTVLNSVECRKKMWYRWEKQWNKLKKTWKRCGKRRGDDEKKTWKRS